MVNTEYQTVLTSCTKPNFEYRNIKFLLLNTIPNIELSNTNYQIFQFGLVIRFLLFYVQPWI